MNVILRQAAVAVASLLAVLAGAWPAAAQTVEYYHLDALGSVRAITDQTGAVLERHDYLPFGEEWNPQPTTDPRKFTGKERDTETGYDYFGARYLSAKTARFTTTDPAFTLADNLVDPQRWNKYAYVRNNPMSRVDPDGRDAVWINNANGTSTLLIPVKFTGQDATAANIAKIISRANGVTVADPKLHIKVVQTNVPINGVMNTLEFKPAFNFQVCGAAGECTNKLGGNKAYINSANGQATDAAAHEVFHFAGITDRYREGPRDSLGNRTSTPTDGYDNSNIMSSRAGTVLRPEQFQEAKGNDSTKKCTQAGC